MAADYAWTEAHHSFVFRSNISKLSSSATHFLRASNGTNKKSTNYIP